MVGRTTRARVRVPLPISDGRRSRISPCGPATPPGRPATTGVGLDIVDLEVEATLHGGLGRQIAYLGPTIRGALGHHLIRQVCRRDGRCETCDLAAACAYPVVFEGRPPHDRSVMTRYQRVPQPFILRVPPPDSARPRDRRLRFAIRVLGDATRWIPDIADTIELIGGIGLGSDRIRFDIDSMRPRVMLRRGDADPPALAPAPRDGRVRWWFDTPLHLSDRIDRGTSPLDGLALVLAGRRRWHLLTSLFGMPGDETPPRVEADAFAVVDRRLKTFAIHRFSGRQKRSVPLRGVTGSMTIDGPWSAAGDWMRAAGLVHLGKHASFGFGAVRWEQVTS